MKIVDPLVSLQPSLQAGLRGWAVAAAIIARLQEIGLSGGIDMRAILGPAISDLSEPELEELARQMSGPLADVGRRQDCRPCPERAARAHERAVSSTHWQASGDGSPQQGVADTGGDAVDRVWPFRHADTSSFSGW